MYTGFLVVKMVLCHEISEFKFKITLKQLQQFFPAHYEPYSSPIKAWQNPIDFSGIKSKPSCGFKNHISTILHLYGIKIPQIPQSFSEQNCS